MTQIKPAALSTVRGRSKVDAYEPWEQKLQTHYEAPELSTAKYYSLDVIVVPKLPD